MLKGSGENNDNYMYTDEERLIIGPAAKIRHSNGNLLSRLYPHLMSKGLWSNPEQYVWLAQGWSEDYLNTATDYTMLLRI